jgi:stearoyl-CoA desaturase (Delta-9 desaturase)
MGGARMLLWAGLVRIFLFQHFASFAVNSLCHTFGRRRFKTDDRSTNLAWLALSSLGEAWHHNHHAFPRSASHGLRRREVDLSGHVIRGLERVGLARNVVRIQPSELHRRAVSNVTLSEPTAPIRDDPATHVVRAPAGNEPTTSA